jgi:dihydrofolate reductase
MTKVFADLSISLDGFNAGPEPSQKDPLGIGGEQLHEWAMNAMSWQQQHGHEGGEDNADSKLMARTRANVGAGLMGRKMYSGGAGGWENDPNPRGWWGDDPPFHHPVYVLTHHAREPLEMEGGTTFHFAGDLSAAYEQAVAAAGEQDVQVHGGGTIVTQLLREGLLDELNVHIAPVLLGSGARLLDDVPAGKLERLETFGSDSTGTVHIRYAVIR